jgi:DNA repair protein RadC
MTNENVTPGYETRIRDLPAGERPRERLRNYGASRLSNAELLAIILRTGLKSESVLSLSTRLLFQFKGLSGLARASFEDLTKVRGFGEAKAAELQAALELGRRLLTVPEVERPTIQGPQNVADLVQAEMAFLAQEHLRVLALNTRNQVVSTEEVYKGNVGSAVVRSSEIFREAVRSNAPSIIIVHNHPSGDPTPSTDDVRVTRQLVEAGRLLEIEVLDHVVVAERGFVSLKDRGLMS